MSIYTVHVMSLAGGGPTFQSFFVRPPPPMLEASEAELRWVHLEDAACLLWDSSLTKSDLTAAQAVDLFGAALLGPLPPPQQQDLINELKKSTAQGLLSQLSVTPEQLPSIVENNPLVAIELLNHLLSTPQSAGFLSALASMDMSLHSMEVVNRLTTTAEVPGEFIHLYVTNCISSCENMKDKYLQNRLVRLVCVFLQSLLRNKIISSGDCSQAVAFCLEFSRIREAAALYRQLAT